MAQPKTLFEKIWDSHLVDVQEDGTCLIYIDRHLIHEVTTPQAFEGLRMAGRKVHRPDLTLGVADHNVPTTDRSQGIDDPESRLQVETLSKNCADFGVPLFDMNDLRQGIVHVFPAAAPGQEREAERARRAVQRLDAARRHEGRLDGRGAAPVAEL